MMEQQFFEDDGVVTLWASDMNEVCIQVESGADQRTPYAAFTPVNARRIAAAIVALADAAGRSAPNN